MSDSIGKEKEGTGVNLQEGPEGLEGSADGSTLGYKEALRELETILESIEEAEEDLDGLSAKVRRASYLISFCRARIGETEIEVRNILSELNGEEETS